MIQKTFKVIIEDKVYNIKEPKVEDYVLFLEDKQAFFEKIFHCNIPNLDEQQITILIEWIFNFEKSFDEIFEDKEAVAFHIILAKLVKYFGNSFDDFMKMNFSFFMQILKDFEKITDEKWEKKVDSAKNAQTLKKFLLD